MWIIYDGIFEINVFLFIFLLLLCKNLFCTPEGNIQGIENFIYQMWKLRFLFILKDFCYSFLAQGLKMDHGLYLTIIKN